MGRFRGVELDHLKLSGERLVLRRWKPSDADRVEEIMRDRSMRRFLALPDPYDAEQARRFVTDIGHEGRGEGTGLGCAMVERNSGRVVGSCALRLTGDAEVGYWVAADARGKGYAAEATEILARFAFEHDVSRLFIGCDAANVASAATALAAGFMFEGVARNGLLGGGRNGVAERRADLARFARLPTDPGRPIAHAFPRLPAAGLSDGVIVLRVMAPEDLPAFEECEDAETVRWSFSGEPRTAAQLRPTTYRAGLEWLVGSNARFAIVDAATGRFAGQLDLRRQGPPQVCGIGYTVHPGFRGRGYTTRALQLASTWAFEHAGIARLELGAKVGNIASQRAAANAGFEPDGIRRGRLRNADGTFGDEARFSLLSPYAYFSMRSKP